MKLLIILAAIVGCIMASHPIAKLLSKKAKARAVIEQPQDDTLIDKIKIQADQPLLLDEVPVQVQPAYTYVCMLPAPCKTIYKISRRVSRMKDPESYIKALLLYVPGWTVRGQSTCSFEVPCDKVPDYAQPYLLRHKRYFD